MTINNKPKQATMAFHKLQLSLCQHKWKLPLENHIHYAMAANYILLLSRNQYQEDLSPYFSNHYLKATINGIETKYDGICRISSYNLNIITLTAQ
jgi:hypothetical protein